MAVRFRIRTSAGQELSFASEDTFEEFVRSGDLSPDDLVYDGETGSWSPARTHPIVLDIEYAREAEEEAAAKAAADVDSAASESASDSDAAAESDGDEGDADAGSAGEDGEEPDSSSAHDFGLELAPVEELSPEEAARAFVEKMEAEREADLDYVPTEQTVGGFTAQDSSTLADMLVPAPEAPPEPKAPAVPVPPPPRREAPRRRESPQRRERGTETRAPARGVGLEKAAASASGPGILGRVKGVLLLLGLVGAAGFAAWVVANGPADPVPIEDPTVPIAPVVVEPVTPTREPVIGTTPAAGGT